VPKAATPKKVAAKSAAARKIDPFLSYLWDNGGSDLLLTAGAPPLVRIDGDLQPMEDSENLAPADVDAIIASVLPAEVSARFKAQKEVDFSFNWHSQARFRGNAFRQRSTASLALRLIPLEIPSFKDLGLPPIVEELVKLQQGLILVTGPTGAGKSTTQASMLDYVNTNRRCHILTIEDPIEYLHHHRTSAINQREVGEDTDSFERALRSALREDPDVLLVGEMRDLESIGITLTIAETGHLVFATLHTNDTAQALDRIVDVFPGDRQSQIRVQLANTLAAVIHQRLIPKIGGGRVAAFEVLIATHAVRNLIKEGKSNQIRNVLATSASEGMQTLEKDLNRLVDEELITHDQAIMHSLLPNEIKKPAPVAPPVGEGKGRKKR
jgi:twitching motility protein PilT